MQQEQLGGIHRDACREIFGSVCAAAADQDYPDYSSAVAPWPAAVGLQEAARAGRGDPGEIWAPQEPSSIPQMVQWIQDPRRGCALSRVSQQLREEPTQPVPLPAACPDTVPPAQAQGLGLRLPLALAVLERGSLEHGLGPGAL